MVMAITNIMLCTYIKILTSDVILIVAALNVLSPFIGGFLIPGKAIGVMIFKVYSTNTLGQA